MPTGAGGEFTQPKNRGWPFPMGWVKTSRRTRSSSASGVTPASGSGRSSSAARSAGVIGVKTGRSRIAAQVVGDQVDGGMGEPPELGRIHRQRSRRNAGELDEIGVTDVSFQWGGPERGRRRTGRDSDARAGRSPPAPWRGSTRTARGPG